MQDEHHRDALLTAARRDFASFYSAASSYDAGLMDGLVLAHAGLLIGINAPRPRTGTAIRDALERMCDETERVFVDLREAVQACPTFTAVDLDTRARIEDVIFNVRPPWFA